MLSDTDTIAAFTSGLIGALHGLSSWIPKKWRSVQDYKYLEKTADRLLSIAQDTWKEENTQLSLEHTNTDSLNSIPKEDDFNINKNDEIAFKPLGRGKIISINKDPLEKNIRIIVC